MHWDGSRAPDLDCTDLQTKVLGWFLFESSLLTSACRPLPWPNEPRARTWRDVLLPSAMRTRSRKPSLWLKITTRASGCLAAA